MESLSQVKRKECEKRRNYTWPKIRSLGEISELESWTEKDVVVGVCSMIWTEKE